MSVAFGLFSILKIQKNIFNWSNKINKNSFILNNQIDYTILL